MLPDELEPGTPIRLLLLLLLVPPLTEAAGAFATKGCSQVSRRNDGDEVLPLSSASAAPAEASIAGRGVDAAAVECRFMCRPLLC